MLFLIQRETKGQDLLDRVFSHLNLIESDYFGLQFTDDHGQKVWLDPIRAVAKQVKGRKLQVVDLLTTMSPLLISGLECITFSLRVKFYPADSSRVREELTRYLIQLQLRRDLVQGRLTCTQDELVYLMACVVQCNYQHTLLSANALIPIVLFS